MNGFFFLILSVAFSSGVALTMKIANNLEINVGQLIAINYLVCTISVMAWGAWNSLGANSIFIWGLSAFIGLMYVLSLWLFNQAISTEGLALSTTLMRLSAALPTLGSLVFFGEEANAFQVMGIALAFLSLPLASNKPFRLGKAKQDTYKGIMWGLLLFATYGITDFTFKIQAELEPLADPQSIYGRYFRYSDADNLVQIGKEEINKAVLGLGGCIRIGEYTGHLFLDPYAVSFARFYCLSNAGPGCHRGDNPG